MSGPVDVRQVLSGLVADMGDTPGTTGPQVAQVLGAVAELIEAGRALQDAMDEHETNRFDIGPSRRFVEADARHRAALARVGGAA